MQHAPLGQSPAVLGDPARPWVRSREARAVLRVSAKTLSDWARHGYIQTLLLPGPGKREHRLFDLASVAARQPPAGNAGGGEANAAAAGATEEEAIYARVSTRKQSADLDRQIAELSARHPGVRVYSDIASGINFHRRGLQALLDRAIAGRVRTVYVAHRDRLCRIRRADTEVVGPPSASHSISSRLFSDGAERVSSWIHRIRRPPPRESWPTTCCPSSRSGLAGWECKPNQPTPDIRSLGRVFTGAAAEAAGASAAAKRRRLGNDGSTTATVRRAPTPRNPLQPNERLVSYRIRLVTTPAQRQALLGWMAAGRWGFNRMVEAVRAGQPASQATANALCQGDGPPEWVRRHYRSVYKNAMMDAVACYQAERTKQQNDPRRRRRGTVGFRSVPRTPTESIRLDGAAFRTDYPECLGKLKDAGPVLRIDGLPGPEPGPTPSGRRRACVYFGKDLEPLGLVLVKDSRRLINRLVDQRYLRHETKLHWIKALRALYLIVLQRQSRPPDPDPDMRDRRVVAIYPGQRSFQTFCDMQTDCHGELLAGY